VGRSLSVSEGIPFAKLAHTTVGPQDSQCDGDDLGAEARQGNAIPQNLAPTPISNPRNATKGLMIRYGFPYWLCLVRNASLFRVRPLFFGRAFYMFINRSFL